MGNTVPKIPMHHINLAPGNVLIFLHNNDSDKQARVANKSGEGINNHLLRGKIIRIGPSIYSAVEPNTLSSLKPGDEVLVRERKGYPIETENGQRLLVYNEWDVAINLGGGAAYQSVNSPPRYE